MRSLDRATVRAMLKKLADTPPPTALAMGAMCYDPMIPPMRAEYVCPRCGERTLYENDKTSDKEWYKRLHGIARTVEWEIPACRRKFEQLRDVSGDAISFDESQFCRKCSPKVTDPKLVLHVRYADGRSYDFEGCESDDLRILRDFLAGKLATEADDESKYPLKDSLPRLQELLGVKPDE
jgi:hypothetical protein